jgi:selenocysteine-specific elongation factor
LAEPSHPRTLGTAGHIDHGKTALVAALTGTDTDRLEEERRRGISIELGFAELDLGEGRTISVVDVPGHDRLVRTMVAGATGIDLFLLVVAADDGVMPQTREHLAVLRALGVEVGVVAITKADLADPARAAEEVRELLPDAVVVAVSARTEEGIQALRDAICDAVDRMPRSEGETGGPPVLHVDRAFTLHGIGTVVTGTLQGGAVEAGADVEVLPGGARGRVRSSQVHNRSVKRAEPGQRVALNLSGVSLDEVDRGDVVTVEGARVDPSYRLDAYLRLEPSTGDLGGQRVQVHHGTRNAPARVVTLGGGEVQLRLESPMIARAGDRFVLRRIAPPDTLGGGEVIDPAPRRHGPQTVPEPEPAPVPETKPAPDLDERALVVLAVLRRDGAEPRSAQDIATALRLDPKEVESSLGALVEADHAERAGQVIFASEELASLRGFATDLARGSGEVTLPQLRDALATSRKYAQAVLESLDSEGITVRHGDVHVLRRP